MQELVDEINAKEAEKRAKREAAEDIPVQPCLHLSVGACMCVFSIPYSASLD